MAVICEYKSLWNLQVLLQLISELCKVAAYKIKIQKLILFLYTIHEN